MYNEVLDWSLVDAVNVPTGTYFPSASGMAVGAVHHISATGELIAAALNTVTLTVEGTNDDDVQNAQWVQVYGYDAKNHVWVNQMQAAAATLTFAWDFDYWNYKHIRCLIATTGGANTVIIKVRGRG